MIKSTIFLASGVATARIVPIIAGLIIAKQYGAATYQIFISFIIISNLITSLSVLGAAPKILSIRLEDKKGFFESIVITSGILFLISSAILYFIEYTLTSFNNIPEKLSYLTILQYSLGFSMLNLSAAKLNNSNKIKHASICWFSLSAVNLLSLMAIVMLDFYRYIAIYAFLTLIIGTFWMKKVISVKYISIRHIIYSHREFISTLQLSFFGLAINGVFFYSNSLALKYDPERAYLFSLFYQIFTLSTFLPTILGNILVPKISKGNSINLKMYLVYFIIATVFSGTFALLHSTITTCYSRNNYYLTNVELLYITIICILASINSYTIQILISKRQYFTLMLYALLWLVVFFVSIYTLNATITSILESLSISYLIPGLVLFYISLQTQITNIIPQ